ncbi:ABC transporter ATP-binding protein [Streptomyces sp. JJ66]|uniref:ABC transporter ATP-binding protein n=1 Tax=Streptomyces sp. JJ66 TaxID=2803843 RepID=UPI001C591F26|nr:ABC transporter ATP-binding protein [Streptomyces sp. JJ66]MBW1600735.1 ABC transporter ATP-binding protein [Streptomyces sp. JJ66]
MAHILDGISADSYDRAYGDRELLRRIRPLFAGRRRTVALIALAVVGAAVAGAAFPLLVANIVDNAEQESLGDAVLPLTAAALGTGVVAWLLTFLQQRAVGVLVGDVVLEMRRRAFEAVLRQDMSFHDAQSSGSVASRITADTQAFATLATLTLGLVGQVLMIGLLLLAMMVINLPLALVTAGTAALIVLVSLGFRWVSRRASRQQQRSLAQINAYVQETLRGIAVARNFQREESTHAGLVEVNQRWYRATVRLNRLFSGIFPLLLTLTGLGTVGVVVLGGGLLTEGAVTAGEWSLFLEALMLFWFPLTSIASFWNQFQQGLAASERIFALVDREPAVRQSDRLPVPRLSGTVEFRGVDFGYRADRPVLTGLDLRIEGGETVALVGHTGAGKSSIIRLITRAYEFGAGELLIDGQDIRTLDLDAYKSHLGIVPQAPFLFSGTVGENIGFGRPGATPEEILAAARSVAGGDWLDVLPEGLDTPVNEGGSSLSAGQRQLIVLARVMLGDPSLLILDEATASVDPLTEALVQEGLDAASAGRTTVVVAHRLPTVRKADRILVVDGGRIAEQGTHDSLRAAGGRYAELYDHYFRHQTLDFEAAKEDADAVLR